MPEGEVYNKIDPPDSQLKSLWDQADRDWSTLSPAKQKKEYKRHNFEMPGIEKKAEHLELDDLFARGNTKRERLWKNKVSGESTYHVGSGLGSSFSTMEKTAESVDPFEDLFKTSAEKKADITKRVDPDETTGKVIKELSDREKDLPKTVLDAMAKQPLEKALTAPSMMGMVLRPREFQRIILVHIGKSDVADDLDKKGVTFSKSDECSKPTSNLGAPHFDADLMKKLLPFMENRSFFEPVVSRRVLRIAVTAPEDRDESEEKSPLLSKIAAAYTWYGQQMLGMTKQASDFAASQPELNAAIWALDDSDIFKSAATDNASLGATLASIPLALMYSSSLRGKKAKGELGAIRGFIADHPKLTALAAATATRELMEDPRVHKAVTDVSMRLANTAIDAVGKITSGA